MKVQPKSICRQFLAIFLVAAMLLSASLNTFAFEDDELAADNVEGIEFVDDIVEAESSVNTEKSTVTDSSVTTTENTDKSVTVKSETKTEVIPETDSVTVENDSTVIVPEEIDENTVVENNSSEETIMNEQLEAAADEKTTYLVSFLNQDGIVEMTQTYHSGDEVDLSLRLGGGEKQLGWSKEENGEALTSFTMPEEDVTLYPVIDKSDVTYQVHFWLENQAGDGYDQADTLTLNGKIGEVVSPDTVQSSENAKSYPGFTYDAASSGSEQTISENGETVVEVRFKRNTYTVTFDINGDYRSVSDLAYASLKMNIGGGVYSGTGYSFTARFGEDISDKWPTAENVVDNPWLSTSYSDYFVGWYDSNGALHTGADVLDEQLLGGGENVNFSAHWTASNGSSNADAPVVTIKYHIYQQNVDNDDYSFTETIEKNAKATSLSTVELAGYAGFHYDHADPVDGTHKTVSYGPWYSPSKASYYEENNVYFARNSYPLNFRVDNETVRTESVRFEASLDEYSNYKPENQPAGRSYFDGWYAEDGALYAFGSMPAEEVTVTGTWLYSPLETATLNYDANGGQGAINSRTAAVGVSLRVTDDSALTAPDGSHFAGWNTAADGSGTAYAADDILELNEDVTLYAIWEKNAVETPTPTPSVSPKPSVSPEPSISPTPAVSVTPTVAPTVTPSVEKANPKTGDESAVGFMTIVLFAAAAGMILAINATKKRQEIKK